MGGGEGFFSILLLLLCFAFFFKTIYLEIIGKARALGDLSADLPSEAIAKGGILSSSRDVGKRFL